METAPAISVVVPVKDMEAELPACLHALTRQNAAAFEVVVVDNGSVDGSRAVAAQFPVRLVEERTPGAAAARNRGIAAARAPLVAFTDADCAPARNWLSGLLTEFRDPEVTVVAGGMTPVAGEDGRLATYASLIGQYGAEATLYHTRFPYAPTASVAVRKDVLQAAGLFDPAFLTYEGADLFYRIHRLGLLRPRVAPRAMVFYRTRSSHQAFIRQNYRYGQGYGRFCYRYRDALEPATRTVAARVAAWRRRVTMGFERIAATGLRPELQAEMKRLHFDRETAQLYGILRWRRLGPPEPAA